MTQVSRFESRKGRPGCFPEELYEFVTDLRNFRQFVPEGKVNSLEIDRESCFFVMPAAGKVSIKIAEKKPVQKVIYSGNVLDDNEFSIWLNIGRLDSGNAEVQLFLDAELNPFLKIMASGPITSFLETLIDEMEKFKGWNRSNA